MQRLLRTFLVLAEGFPVAWRVRLAVTAGLIVANLGAMVIVYFMITTVIPLPEAPDAEQLRADNLKLVIGYIGIAGGIGLAQGTRDFEPLVRLLQSVEQATDDERRRVLGAPLIMLNRQLVLWSIGALLFGVFNYLHAPQLGLAIAWLVTLTGWSVCCVTYLTTERALRPLAGRVLADGVPSQVGVRRVSTRMTFAWALGTGTSILGLTLIGASVLVDPEGVSLRELSLTIVCFGILTLVVGGFTNFLASRAASDPIQELRTGLDLVKQGQLDTRIHIYDGTELGVLQAGFNEMVAGLAERELIRDLFGRHVGGDVAKRALHGEVTLGGEVREVSVLFVDLIGSTEIAAERPPQEVVAVLNRFFTVVIDVVHEFDGWINKFEGDAALAIWGAPVPVSNRDTKALRAARVMAARLAREVPEVGAGIGVSSGMVVAGNVGAAERYEYTVIGDAVNEAARLTDVAKRAPGRVAANARLLTQARRDEVEHWEAFEELVLRGRQSVTDVVAPRIR